MCRAVHELGGGAPGPAASSDAASLSGMLCRGVSASLLDGGICGAAILEGVPRNFAAPTICSPSTIKVHNCARG